MGHLVTLFQNKKVIVQDSFNRADNALTMGNASTGQVWVPLSGTWGISANQAYTTDTVGTDIAAVDDPRSANAILSTTIKFSANEGMVFRLTDANNHLNLRIIANEIALVRTVATVTTNIGSFSFTPIVGMLYSVKVICNGSSIQAFLNGVLILTATETFNQTATKCGLRTNVSTAGRFDNFLMEAL